MSNISKNNLSTEFISSNMLRIYQIFLVFILLMFVSASAFASQASVEDTENGLTSSQVSAQALVKYEETSASIVYTGTWTSYPCGPCSGGALKYTTLKNNAASLSFTGKKITWVGAKHNQMGKANVYVDGVLKQTVDLYRSTTSVGQTLYSYTWATSGNHTIKIVASGTKNTSSRGIFINLDYFQVDQPTSVVNVSGYISSNTTWTASNVYLINSWATLNSGVTLTIEPGTVIKFGSGAEMDISGTLNATGTSLKPIYFTSVKDDSVGGDTNGDGNATIPAAGNWESIDQSSGSTAIFKYAKFHYGGYSSGTSYVIYNSSGSLTLASSDIYKSGSGGIYTYYGDATIVGNTLSYLQTLPIDINNASSFISSSISGNTGSNNTMNGIEMEGYLSNNFTLNQNPGFVYEVESWLTVNSGKTLTIPAGTVVKFASLGELDVSGTLNATGTSQNPIYFTSVKDDSVGGDTNGDGNATTPAAGNWESIDQSSGSTAIFKYAKFHYGGNSSGTSYVIYNSSGSLTLASSDIYKSGSGGIYTYYGDATIVGNTLSYLQTLPIDINSANSFISSSISGNTGSNNTFNGIEMEGYLSNNFTLNQNPGLVYVVNSWLNVNSGKTLTIPAGTVVKSVSLGAIDVDGTLNATGTSLNPIYLTSVKDDSVGGDTNGDGNATTPAAGNWEDLWFDAGSSGTLDYVTVSYGGGNGYNEPIGISDCSVTFSSSNLSLINNVTNAVDPC